MRRNKTYHAAERTQWVCSVAEPAWWMPACRELGHVVVRNRPDEHVALLKLHVALLNLRGELVVLRNLMMLCSVAKST